MPTAPRTPAQVHYEAAERGLAELGRLGLDSQERIVEVLVALVHATLANVNPRKLRQRRPAPGLPPTTGGSLADRWARGEFDPPDKGDS
jgi:hypothetical protein